MDTKYLLAKFPQREKMEPDLEVLRWLTIRHRACAREFGRDHPETKRLGYHANELWAKLTNKQQDAFKTYMYGGEPKAIVPEVPKEAEQERSI